jgi:hypothetical protein
MAGDLKKRFPGDEDPSLKPHIITDDGSGSEVISCVPAILVPTGEGFIPLSLDDARMAYDSLKEFFDESGDE